jgi:hypothetical protein
MSAKIPQLERLSKLFFLVAAQNNCSPLCSLDTVRVPELIPVKLK